MIFLTDQELTLIQGGLKLSGALLNAISRGISSIMDVGRSLGSAIRRAWKGTTCPL